ncbi:MAG: transposase [Solirubrobacteraceae bacterium]
MPRSYPSEVRRQVIELARAGTRVQQLSKTFGMTETTVYNWLKQDRIDRGEVSGVSTDQQLELAVARRQIRQLETELAVARKVNEVFLREGISPKVSGAVAGHAGVVKMVKDADAVRLTPRLCLVPVEARQKFGAGPLPECRTVP